MRHWTYVGKVCDNPLNSFPQNLFLKLLLRQNIPFPAPLPHSLPKLPKWWSFNSCVVKMCWISFHHLKFSYSFHTLCSHMSCCLQSSKRWCQCITSVLIDFLSLVLDLYLLVSQVLGWHSVMCSKFIPMPQFHNFIRKSLIC